MMDEKLIRILSKVYKYDDEYEHDFERGVDIFSVPHNIKTKEVKLIEESKIELNKITHYQHDSTVSRLKSLLSQHADLERYVILFFLKAIGSAMHRGLQPIVSYFFAKNMPQHTYSPIDFKAMGLQIDNPEEVPCKICGLKKSGWENDSKNLFDLYRGYCRLGGSGAYFETLMDLEEMTKYKDLTALDSDVKTFKRLIELIEEAQEEETLSVLRERLSKSQLIPKSNQTTRHWLINILAELGVLRNKFDPHYGLKKFTPYENKLKWELQLHKEAPNHRIEVYFPLSAWRGKLGVNKEMVNYLLNAL